MHPIWIITIMRNFVKYGFMKSGFVWCQAPRTWSIIDIFILSSGAFDLSATSWRRLFICRDNNKEIIRGQRKVRIVNITGKLSNGFPVFSAYILLKTCIASSFLPWDIRNFGLSGKNSKVAHPKNGGTLINRIKTRHALYTKAPPKKDTDHDCGITSQAITNSILLDMAMIIHRINNSLLIHSLEHTWKSDVSQGWKCACPQQSSRSVFVAVKLSQVCQVYCKRTVDSGKKKKIKFGL